MFKTVVDALRIADREASARSEAEALALDLAEAVAERDRFVDLAAHELRTPITALKLQLQLNERLLRKHGAEAFDEEKCGKILSRSLQQCDRLSRLVDDMLDVSRIRAGRFMIQKRNQSLSDLLTKIAESYRRDLETAGHDLALSIAPGIEAEVDVDRISRIYTSLLSNVIRHGVGGGVEIFLERDGDEIVTRVRDYGPGVPEAAQATLFDPSGASKELAGLGMSLHIARAIARAHGGDLQFDSDWKRGAEFVLRLPAIATAESSDSA